METTNLDWATFALLVCTTIFTSILMIGAILTARQARRSADAATETARMAGSEHEARMRPWVGMVELECQDKDWKVLNTWQMTLRNFGILPASDVKIEIVVSIESKQEWELDPPATLGMLYPTQQRSFQFSFGEDFTEIFTGQEPNRTIMAVHVHYRVHAVKDQLTEYCLYRIDPEHKTWFPVLETLIEPIEFNHSEKQ